jgi:hypothetical protein
MKLGMAFSLILTVYHVPFQIVLSDTDSIPLAALGDNVNADREAIPEAWCRGYLLLTRERAQRVDLPFA